MRHHLAGFFLGFFLFSGTAMAAESLYPTYQGKLVKVFVSEVKNTSSEQTISTEEFKKALIEALKSRHSITFEAVDAKENAELVIEANVREYYWTDKDPIDMLMGVGGTAMDAAVTEDYARIEAYFVVKDGKGRVLWQDGVMSTETKKPMSKADSIPLVTAGLAKQFVRECFGKKR